MKGTSLDGDVTSETDAGDAFMGDEFSALAMETATAPMQSPPGGGLTVELEEGEGICVVCDLSFEDC